jgi:thioredoxin reductase (NADPH)
MPSPTSPRNPSPLDVAIVGAGPVGLACGIAVTRAGLSCRILEKGCIVDSIFRFPVEMTFFTTPELMEIGGHPLVTGPHGKSTRGQALDYYRAVARTEGLAVETRQRVLRVEAQEGSFSVVCESRGNELRHDARWVVLATGYFDDPNLLGIPGEDLPHVSHYYTEAHPFAGERVLVVGGRNSACEAALDLFRHDAHVTVVHRGSTFGEGVKYWVQPDIENRIRAGEIRALFETTPRSITPRTVRLARGTEEFEEPFDQVFLLTGYHPNQDFLRACGLRPDPETLAVKIDPETHESLDVPGIYLAGSASAGRRTGSIFIENGRLDAGRIAYRLAALRGARS